MEFKDKKDVLIKNGNHLLSFVKKKNFGMEIIQDVMDERYIEELKAWFKDAEEFVEFYGLECHKERFKASSWIINQDERVSLERIKNILNIIERIMNKQ